MRRGSWQAPPEANSISSSQIIPEGSDRTEAGAAIKATANSAINPMSKHAIGFRFSRTRRVIHLNYEPFNLKRAIDRFVNVLRI